MSSRLQPPFTPGLRLLVLTLSALAALLWLLPALSPHSVLFPSGPVFEDIRVYKGRFTVYHSLKFFTSRAFSAFAYPPGAAPIYEAFYKTVDAVQTYILLALLVAAAALIGLWICLRRFGKTDLFVPLLAFCFPLVFLIQRANIEIVLWIVVLLGIVAARRGASTPAAVLFGLAAAVKLYPVFLLGLFLKQRRQLPAFLVGAATASLALIAATAYAGPTFLVAANGFTHGVGNFQTHYVDTVSPVEVTWDHSLFSPLKYLAYLHHISPAAWTRPYYLLAGAFALLLFLRVRTLPFTNRVVFLAAAMVCLPPVSFDYTLVHLYLPALLLLGALTVAQPPTTALLCLALLLFLLLPLAALQVFHTGTQPLPTGPLQSCALFAVLLLASIAPWPEAPATRAA